METVLGVGTLSTRGTNSIYQHRQTLPNTSSQVFMVLELYNIIAVNEVPHDLYLVSLTPLRMEPYCFWSLKRITCLFLARWAHKPREQASLEFLNRECSDICAVALPETPTQSRSAVQFIFPLETNLAVNLHEGKAYVSQNHYLIFMYSVMEK